MKLFTRTTRWSEYLSAQVAAAEVDERYADAVVEKIKALKSLENKSEKTVAAAKAHAYTDQQYLDALNEQQRAYAFRKLITAVYDNSERTAALLSRELTRRVNRDTRERRVERWNP
jgi:acyl-CoA reductase-like NAD-dependent aldehyde dehydrogenase